MSKGSMALHRNLLAAMALSAELAIDPGAVRRGTAPSSLSPNSAPTSAQGDSTCGYAANSAVGTMSPLQCRARQEHRPKVCAGVDGLRRSVARRRQNANCAHRGRSLIHGQAEACKCGRQHDLIARLRTLLAGDLTPTRLRARSTLSHCSKPPATRPPVMCLS